MPAASPPAPTPAPPLTTITPRADDYRTQAQLASRDAAVVLATLSRGPVAGVVQAYTNLGPSRALGAGIALLALFVLSLVVGYGRIVGAGLGLLSGGLFEASGEGLATTGAYLKVAFVGLVPAGGAVLVSLIGRQMSRAGGSVGGDVYTAGCALLPIALWLLAAFVLGAANFEVIAFLGLFAVSYFVLLYYNGLTRIGRLSADFAALLVPIALFSMAYLTKIAIASLL